MKTVLIHRNPRLVLPNPNFIRNFADKNEKIEVQKPVASQILQSSTSELDKEQAKESENIITPNIIMSCPEEPTTCCMSGCANCVWLDYAEKITAYFKDGGERAEKEINERISDSNIKAFLLQELRMNAKKH